MHTRGRSRTMYAEARLRRSRGARSSRELRREPSARAAGAGVPRERLIVDPGIGFAKRAAHSYGVLARLPELAAALDRPILVGPSRKSFMREALGDRPPASATGARRRRSRPPSWLARTSSACTPSPRWRRSCAWPTRSEQGRRLDGSTRITMNWLTTSCAGRRHRAGGTWSTSSWCRSSSTRSSS